MKKPRRVLSMLMGGGLVGRDLKRVPEDGEEVILAKPQGKDVVPVILQPGELIVNKDNVSRVLPLLKKYDIRIPGLEAQESQYGEPMAAMARGGRVRVSAKKGKNVAIARGRGARAKIDRSKQKVTQKVTINIGGGRSAEDAAEDMARSSDVQRPGVRRGMGSGLGVRRAPGPGLAAWPSVVAALGPAAPVVPAATPTPAVAAAPVPALPVPGAPAAAPTAPVALPVPPIPIAPSPALMPPPPYEEGEEEGIDLTQTRVPSSSTLLGLAYLMGFQPDRVNRYSDRRVRINPEVDMRYFDREEPPRGISIEEIQPTAAPAEPTLLPPIPSPPASEGLPSPPPELSEAPPVGVAEPAATIPLQGLEGTQEPTAPQEPNAVEVALESGNRVVKRDLARYIYNRREAYGFPPGLSFTSFNALPANYLLGIVDLGGYGRNVSPIPGLEEQQSAADVRAYFDAVFGEEPPQTWAERRRQRA